MEDLTKNEAMYREVLEHWVEIWKAFKDDKVVGVSADCKSINIGEKIIYYHSGVCAYCDVYLAYLYDLAVCKGCPIHIKTGENSCRNTPWYKFNHNPSEETAFAFLEFVRNTPPEGVEVIELEELTNENVQNYKVK